MLEVKSGSECGPVIVNSPQAIAATEYYKSLMAFSPPDTLNYFWDDVMALMQQGKVAELIMWNDATYAVAVDENASTVVGKMGFDLVPQGEGGKVAQVEGWSYLVPTSLQEQGSRLSLHPVDDGLRPAAQPAPEWRRVRTSGRLCFGRGAEATLREGVDGLERGGQAKADDPAIERDDRYPRARAVLLSGRREVGEGSARPLGEGNLGTARSNARR